MDPMASILALPKFLSLYHAPKKAKKIHWASPIHPKYHIVNKTNWVTPFHEQFLVGHGRNHFLGPSRFLNSNNLTYNNALPLCHPILRFHLFRHHWLKHWLSLMLVLSLGGYKAFHAHFRWIVWQKAFGIEKYFLEIVCTFLTVKRHPRYPENHNFTK